MSKSSKLEQQKGTKAAPEEKQLPVAIDYAADAGAGMENATSESFAIPFLTVIQTNSPQVDKNDAKFIKGAAAGMLLNTVTGKVYDGEAGAVFVPAAYRRVFLQWGPRQGEGGGFKGEFTADQVATLRAERKIVEFEGRLYEPLGDGSVNPKRCNRFSDTRLHYGLLIDESSGEYMQVLLSLTSTQIKKSKALMSSLSSVRVQTPNGKVTPPTFASLVRVTTVPESNDQGNWHGLKFMLDGQVKDQSVYFAAKAFHDTVLKGSVTANYAEHETEGGDKPQEGF